MAATRIDSRDGVHRAAIGGAGPGRMVAARATRPLGCTSRVMRLGGLGFLGLESSQKLDPSDICDPIGFAGLEKKNSFYARAEPPAGSIR